MKAASLPQFLHNARRLGEVVNILAKYGLADWLSHTEFEQPKKLFTDAAGASLTEQSHSARIRLVLTELGTTYIKFGPMLSTRPDLVGEETASELARLQHNVPPDSMEVVLTTVAKELGRQADEVFAEFDRTSIGSASIGQVHAARLQDGREVVVKIQHPGIEPTIRDDLDILQKLAGLAEKSATLKRYRPVAVVSEFRRSLLRELDFNRESTNLQQFANNFATDPTVHFPAVIPELSTRRVLTMELIDGAGLSDAERIDQIGISREELARRGATIWMEMIFRDGFFHADPHPGNLLVLDGGVIGIIDCGMVGRIDESLRETIEDGLLAISNRDGAHLVQLLMQLCSAPADFDEAAFGGDVADYVGFYGSQPLDRLQLGGALNELIRILSEYELVLPAGVSILIKTLAMLESTARLLNPSVNVLELIKSYQLKVLKRRYTPRAQWQKWQRALGEWRRIAEALPKGLDEALRKIHEGKFDIHLQHRRLEPIVNRLVLGMIISSLFLGSAILWSNRVPPLAGGYSIAGVAGWALSIFLGWRLCANIRQE